MRALAIIAWVASVLLVGACSDSEKKKSGEIPLPTYTVDTTVQRAITEISDDDGAVRPVAGLTDASGAVAHFVEREVLLATNSESELNDVMQRWKGTLVETVDLSGNTDLPLDTPKIHIIRIDPSLCDTSTLVADVRSKDENATGEVRVSSESGLKLMAAAARELASGKTIGLNFVTMPEGYTDGNMADGPSGPNNDSFTYSENPANWPYMKQGGPLDINVAGAWKLLEDNGKLNGPRVPILILDGGFVGNHPDYAPEGRIIPPEHADRRNSYSTEGGTDASWHGTYVTLAAAGMPNNHFGGAGSGGPVVRPIMGSTGGDLLSLVRRIPALLTTGARIVNISGAAKIVAGAALFADPVIDTITGSLRRGGVLIFAAAGNVNEDVDAEDCVPLINWPCWEKFVIAPCENSGVICVGGTVWTGPNKHPSSRYGSKNEAASVDIAAPFQYYLGQEPPNAGNATPVVKSGTSFSSPFVAGIAAMIWAANRTLTASQVEQILMETAHAAPASALTKRWPNAYAAVERAIGRDNLNHPPTIQITGPANNATFAAGQNVTFVASTTDTEDAGACCNVTWVSSVDGSIGTGKSMQHAFTSQGTHVITATARDAHGAAATATVTITIGTPPPPAATITQPTGDTNVYRGVSLTFRGTGTANNQQLDCSKLSWTSSGGDSGFPATGCEVTVSFGTNGQRTITLTATEGGQQGTATVNVTVVDPPATPVPVPRITSPVEGAIFADNKVAITINGEVGGLPDTAVYTAQWSYLVEGAKAPVVLGDFNDKKPGFFWVPFDSGVTCVPINKKVTIILKATSGGITATDQVTITLTCAPV